jgi:hypothetical protein
LGTAPFVFGVATAAVIVVKLAVQPGLAADVGRNVLVAVEAQPVLRFLVEADMALLAVLLVLGVPGDHLAGHQDLFDRLRLCAANADQRSEPDEKTAQPVNTCGQRRHGRFH